MSFREEYIAKVPEFEGSIPHMYLDSKGFVSVAIGKMLPNMAAALLLPFRTQDGKPATDAQIKADYARVAMMPENLPAHRYCCERSLVLPASEVRDLLVQCVDDAIDGLVRSVPSFRAAPDAAKLGMIDMDFNLGATKRKTKFPKYNSTICAGDWSTAAKECHRAAPVSESRNDWTRKQFEAAAKG